MLEAYANGSQIMCIFLAEYFTSPFTSHSLNSFTDWQKKMPLFAVLSIHNRFPRAKLSH